MRRVATRAPAYSGDIRRPLVLLNRQQIDDNSIPNRRLPRSQSTARPTGLHVTIRTRQWSAAGLHITLRGRSDNDHCRQVLTDDSTADEWTLTTWLRTRVPFADGVAPLLQSTIEQRDIAADRPFNEVVADGRAIARGAWAPDRQKVVASHPATPAREHERFLVSAKSA
jgi:hypothetical protein